MPRMVEGAQYSRTGCEAAKLCSSQVHTLVWKSNTGLLRATSRAYRRLASACSPSRALPAVLRGNRGLSACSQQEQGQEMANRGYDVIMKHEAEIDIMLTKTPMRACCTCCLIAEASLTSRTLHPDLPLQSMTHTTTAEAKRAGPN